MNLDSFHLQPGPLRQPGWAEQQHHGADGHEGGIGDRLQDVQALQGDPGGAGAEGGVRGQHFALGLDLD